MSEVKRLQQIFKDAASQASTDRKLFFIDPTQFTSNAKHNIENLRQQAAAQNYPLEKLIKEHAPNPSITTDTYLNDIVNSVRSNGPFVMNMGDGSCLVNINDDRFKTKESMVGNFSLHLDPKYLNPIPGKTEDYVRFVAEHEAQHCNQANDVEPLDLFKRENDADYTSLQNSPADVAKTILQIRALRAPSDPGHASHHALDSKHSPDGPNQNNFYAAQTFENERNIRVASFITGEDRNTILENEHHLKAAELYARNPELYYQAMEGALKEGYFDDDPDIKQHASHELEAARALIKLDELSKDREKVAKEYAEDAIQREAEEEAEAEKTEDPEENIEAKDKKQSAAEIEQSYQDFKSQTRARIDEASNTPALKTDDLGRITRQIQSGALRDSEGSVIRSGDGSPVQVEQTIEQPKPANRPNIGIEFSQAAERGLKKSIDLNGAFQAAASGQVTELAPVAPAMQYSANDSTYKLSANTFG